MAAGAGGSFMTCSISDPDTATGAGPWFTMRTVVVSSTEEKTAVIHLRGELDVTVRTTVAELLAPLSDIRPDRLVIDLDQADFLDCGTAAVIFNAARNALRPGEMPVIRAQGPLIRRVLQLSGWDTRCVMQA